MPQAPLRLRFVGAPLLTQAGGAEHPLSARDALLLLRLARQREVSRHLLAAWIWPDADRRRAALSLRQRLFRLERKAGRPLVMGDATLALTVDVAHDLDDQATGFDPEGVGSAGELLELSLAGIGEEALDWLHAERESRRQRRVSMLAQRAETLAGEGRLAEALVVAQRLVLEAPALEHAHRRLMRLHYLRGDVAAALAAYRRCREVLASSLGTAPSAETNELAAQIERANRQRPQPLSCPTAAVPTLVHLLRPPRLVGREGDWRRMEEAWHAQRHVLVAGEPGMGKSRLVSDFAAAMQVPVLECRVGERELSYGLLARLVGCWHGQCGAPSESWAVREMARWVPALGTAATAPVSASRVHDALQNWATHVVTAGLSGMAVDDLQFCDAASLEALLAVVDRPGTLRWLLAVRVNEQPAPLERWLAQTMHVDRLAIAPLDRAGMDELVVSLGLDPAHWTEGLLRTAGGHPFLTLQLLGQGLRTGATDASALARPARLGELLERRLHQLSPRALQLTQLAALAPSDFSADLAAAMWGVNVLELAPAWLELQAAHVLRDSALAHDLMREAAERTVPGPIASVLHRELATLGQRMGMPAVRRARHWLAAGAKVPAAAALLEAATQAGNASRRVEEAALLDEALACFAHEADDTALFAVLERRVAAGRYVDRWDRQIELADRLVAQARNKEQRLRAALARADVLADGHHFERALDEAEHARAAGAQGVALRDATRLRARALMGLGRAAEALQSLPAKPAELLQDPTLRDARFLSDLGVVLIKSDRPREAWPILRRARALAEGAADWGLAAEIAVNLGWVQTTLAQARRALCCYEHAQRLHALTGAAHSPGTMHFVGLARLYRTVGRFDRALELLQAIIAEQRCSAGFRLHTVAEHDLALTYLCLGRPALALQALGGDEPPADAYQPAWLLARGRVAQWTGQPGQPWLDRAWSLARGEGQRVLRWIAGAQRAHVLPADEGVLLASELLAEAESVDNELGSSLLRTVLCDRLLARGDGAAAGHATRLLAQFRHRVPPSMYAPQFWLIVGDALAAARDEEGAAMAFSIGQRWLRDAHVPAVFRESFAERNPFNRRLLILRT